MKQYPPALRETPDGKSVHQHIREALEGPARTFDESHPLAPDVPRFKIVRGHGLTEDRVDEADTLEEAARIYGQAPVESIVWRRTAPSPSFTIAPGPPRGYLTWTYEIVQVSEFRHLVPA